MTAQTSLQQLRGPLKSCRELRLPRLACFFAPRRRRPGKSVGIICGIFLLGAHLTVQAAVLTVTNTDDSGAGSLRQAIMNSNASAGVLDTITFNISGAGVHSITPLTELPTISDPVVINGYSQPGSSANTMAVGDNSIHLIELNGNGAAFAGLTITAGSSTVNGLVINRFNGNGPANGINFFTKGGNTITGCFIGLDSTGVTDLSNSRNGIDVESANNTIGGTTPQARNIIFGPAYAIYVPTGNAGGNTIQGNYVGTNAQGNDGLTTFSTAGIYMETANNIVGGSTAGAGNVISGLGLETRGDGTIIQGNHVGISADGTTALSNGNAGVMIVRASDNLIGGTTVAARNVIGGSSNRVTISGPATGNIIQGNYIGTDAAGTTGLPVGGSFGFGVRIEGATNTLVGGTVAGARNIISNSLEGVDIFDSPSGNNLVQGNYIGTDATGMVALPNQIAGVDIFTSGGPPTSDNTIGGTAPGAGNVISGNGGDGVNVEGAFSSNNTIRGNFIGVAADGVTALGNHGNGVQITANTTGNNNVIGGTAAGAGNVIAYNGVTNSLDAGIRIVGGTGNSILGNSIFSNVVLGINLANNDNVTPNDLGDADTGPNNLQNYPKITSVTAAGGNVTISGSLNSTASTTFRLEYFTNAMANASLFGEGQTFLGFSDVTTDGTGNATYNVTFPLVAPIGPITATATDPDGNTSEFSAAFGTNLLNISTRLKVLTGDSVLIGGFIVTGSESKKVIVRAIGPSLSLAGISGALADPVLELHQPDGSVVTNDNWRDTQEAEIIASTVPPADNLESAIVATLPPGPYTAIESGKNSGTGVGLVEVYDLDQSAGATLANISTRGFVNTGENVMIGGFIIGPSDTGSANVLVRAIGPSLSDSGVANPLQDPFLELHDANGATLTTNDNWKDTQQTEIEATGVPPTDDRESAIVSTLAPGAYTAIVRGTNNATGVGLVEVYHLP